MPNNPTHEPTPAQHEALHKIIDRLPSWSDRFADHSECQQTITSLRSMLDSQGRVSEQHRERVQELAAEIERYRQRSRDEDTARIRLNHDRIALRDILADIVATYTGGVYCTSCGEPVDDCDCVIGKARKALR